MSVIGVDTDSKGFAWYRTAKYGEPTSGFYKSADKDPDVRRAEMLPVFVRMLTDQHKRGDWVVIEEPLALSKNGKTTRLLGLAAGALWAMGTVAPLKDARFAWADVAAWKKEIVGNGNASKLMVAEWAIPQLQAAGDGWTYQRTADCPDLFDAYAIARYGEILRKLARA